MSNIEFIDGTVKIGELGSITKQEYSAIKMCLFLGHIEQSVDIVIFRCGYTYDKAELIVYELI